MSAIPSAGYFLRATVVLLTVTFAFVGAWVKLEQLNRSLAPREERLVMVDATAPTQSGHSYQTVGEALAHAASADDEAAWTVLLGAGSHEVFTVPPELEDVTIEGVSRQDTVVEASEPIASAAGELTLRNLTVRATGGGTAVDHDAVAALNVESCTFAGAGSGVAVSLASLEGRITNSSYAGFDEAISVQTDAPASASVLWVSGNSFEDCDVALLGAVGCHEDLPAACGRLVFSYNDVAGDDGGMRARVVVAADKPGLIEADVHGNSLKNAVVTLANVEVPVGSGGANADVAAGNDLCPQSYCIEVAKPEEASVASVSYRAARDGCGQWELSDDVSESANQEALSVAVARANERGAQTGDYTLSLAAPVAATAKEGYMARDLVLLDGGLSWRGDADPEPASVIPQTSVSLRGARLGDGQFGFVLKDTLGNVVSSARNDAEGLVRFDLLSFARRGTYIYTIEQVDDGQQGISYDQATTTLTVSVTYDGEKGALVPELGYASSGGFRNEAAS